MAGWADDTAGEFASLLLSRVARSGTAVVAVDGRSGSGKTTLADTLCRCIPKSVVVHTDDVAWHHSFFDWTDLLVGGVLDGVRRGEAVSFRPPAWDERGRDGAIAVPANSSVLVVEGVGAGRTELTDWTDVLVWVQSDYQHAERRGIVRDGGDQQAASFWREWMEQENPFQESQRPWNRAHLIVNGTPATPLRQGYLQYAAGPL